MSLLFYFEFICNLNLVDKNLHNNDLGNHSSQLNVGGIVIKMRATLKRSLDRVPIQKLSDEQKQEMLNRFRDQSFIHATDIAREYHVSNKTISSVLSRSGIKCYIAARQVPLTEDQKIYRLAFCHRMLKIFENDENFYKTIMFSDEKTFTSDSKHQKRVYRPANRRFQPEYVTEDRSSGRITANY